MPAALETPTIPGPLSYPEGWGSPEVITTTICVSSHTSWKAVLMFHTSVQMSRNDHADVSQSFYFPSLNYNGGHCPIAIKAVPYHIADTEIVILFIKIIWWHIWANNENRNDFVAQNRKLGFFLFLHNKEAWVCCWYRFNIYCCPSFGSVPSEIPLALPLWFQDGHKELQNDIPLSKGITWNLSFNAPTPYQEEKHLPEVPDQDPHIFHWPELEHVGTLSSA